MVKRLRFVIGTTKSARSPFHFRAALHDSFVPGDTQQGYKSRVGRTQAMSVTGIFHQIDWLKLSPLPLRSLTGTTRSWLGQYFIPQEFEFMGRAMGWKDILASLTTNPAAYFKATTKGRVEKGIDADLVVLDADPAADVRNLAKVKYTIRGGSIIYSEK